MKIVLIGLRGSGKTKIGKLLSEKLNLPLIDLDREIEKAENCPVADIVKNYSWEYFRKKEKEVVKKITKISSAVISTGGGTIIDSENRKILKKDSTVIYLKRTPEDCFRYIKQKKNRPSLTGEKDLLKDLKQVYKDRKAIYEKVADITINRTEDLKRDVEKIIKSF